jgi:hypothetical protein
MLSEKTINEIATYCFDKKIIFEIDTQSDINSTHYKMVDGKYIFTVFICNPKDKNLDKIIDDGFINLKNFINQLPGK